MPTTQQICFKLRTKQVGATSQKSSLQEILEPLFKIEDMFVKQVGML